MKALLMDPERDFEIDSPLRENAEDLIRDLELAPLINTAARGDKLIRQAFSRALLGEAENAAAVVHRQEVLADCRAAPDLARKLYTLAWRRCRPNGECCRCGVVMSPARS